MMMDEQPIVSVRSLTHSYDSGSGGSSGGETTRTALDAIRFDVRPGEIFGLLGPNGSGKTTLFRILSTLLPPPGPGVVFVAGHDVASDRDPVRRQIGVVFQSPGIDKQLTAEENLTYQGHLYGLRGAALRTRVAEALAAVALTDRKSELTSRLSGGMRRRVEVAKGLLHRPRVLLMDEPTTGLDPAARIDLWDHLRRISGPPDGVTVLVTTHLMDDAELCSRLGILAEGRLIACGTPAALKEQIGGDVITLSTRDPASLIAALRERLGITDAKSLDSDGNQWGKTRALRVPANIVRFERARGHELVPAIIEAAPGLVESVAVGKPTLQDVFIRLTGRRFVADEPTTGDDERAPGQPPAGRGDRRP